MARPNILLLMADDLNYNSIGCFGCPVDDITPNLDDLASRGVCFDNAHVTIAVCQPSRECLLTGLYPHKNGAPGFMPISEDIPTLTETLKKNGYFNGIIGKLKHAVPMDKFAWDYASRMMEPESNYGRSPELYRSRSAEFFRLAKEEGKPFFLMANTHDPHRPFAGSDDEVNKFYGYHIYAERFYRSDEAWVPPFLPDLPEVRKELAQYYSSVHRGDQSMGAVMESLREAGLEDNTLVIFMSDNGMAFPFAKANCYLNSTKTPFIAVWPGHIAPGTRNDKDLISGVDFAPTVLEACGLEDKMECDGKSYLQILEGKEDEERDKFVYTQFNLTSAFNAYPMRCIQNRRFGYIYNSWSDGEKEFKNEAQTGLTFRAMEKAGEENSAIKDRVDFFRYRVPEEFYDFQKDPDALHNLIDDPEYREEVDMLRRKLNEYMEKYKDPLLEKYHTDAYDNRIEDCRKAFINKMKTVGNEAMNYRNVKNPWLQGGKKGN
ncbi:MAG: sulfatase [Candidatus Ornithospirochaeta sp.]